MSLLALLSTLADAEDQDTWRAARRILNAALDGDTECMLNLDSDSPPALQHPDLLLTSVDHPLYTHLAEW